MTVPDSDVEHDMSIEALGLRVTDHWEKVPGNIEHIASRLAEMWRERYGGMGSVRRREFRRNVAQVLHCMADEIDYFGDMAVREREATDFLRSG